MNNLLVSKFLKKRKTWDDKKYLFATIAYHIAPTISKQKPASLLNFTKGIRDLHELWEKYKQDFMDNTSLECYEIRRTENSTLVLFYDYNNLTKVLFQKNNIDFLQQFGYGKEKILNQYLETLKNRFERSCAHEVGIFLGMPVEDVISFIECKGKDYLFCRYWKVYNNPNKALTTFRVYDKAKFRVLNQIINNMEPNLLLNVR
jgi:hypothetical protein